MFENDQCIVVNMDLNEPKPFDPLLAEQTAFTLPENTGLLLNIEGDEPIPDVFWSQLSTALAFVLPANFKQFFINVDSETNIPAAFFTHPRFQTLLTIGVIARLDLASWQALLTTAFDNPTLHAFTYGSELNAKQFDLLLAKLNRQSAPMLKQLTLNHANISTEQATNLVAQTAPLKLKRLDLAWNPIRIEDTIVSLMAFNTFSESLFDGTITTLHLASVTDREAFILSKILEILTKPLHLSLDAIDGLTIAGLKSLLSTIQHNHLIKVSVENLEEALSESKVHKQLQAQSSQNSIPSLFWLTSRKITQEVTSFLPHIDSSFLSLLPAQNLTQYLHLKRLETIRDNNLAKLQPAASSYSKTEYVQESTLIMKDYEQDLITSWRSLKLD